MIFLHHQSRYSSISEFIMLSDCHLTDTFANSQQHQITGRYRDAFASFFTWCQTCRHGGHAAHLHDWFAENRECPVYGCVCVCMQID